MLDLEEIVKNCQESGEKWADASTLYNRLDRGFKTKFAQVKDLVRKTVVPPKGKWTNDDLDDATHCHPDWDTFLKDLDKAYEQMIKSRVSYDSWRNALDAARSISANERAEKWG